MQYNWPIILVSAVTNGAISAAGIIISAITGDNRLQDVTWILCGAWFVFSMAKDIQARLAQPPVRQQQAPKAPEGAG